MLAQIVRQAAETRRSSIGKPMDDPLDTLGLPRWHAHHRCDIGIRVSFHRRAGCALRHNPPRLEHDNGR
jgi:hypothetical protein